MILTMIHPFRVDQAIRVDQSSPSATGLIYLIHLIQHGLQTYTRNRNDRHCRFRLFTIVLIKKGRSVRSLEQALCHGACADPPSDPPLPRVDQQNHKGAT